MRWRFLICADDLVLRHGQTSDAGVKQRIATAYEQRTGCTLEERIQQRISGVD